MKREKPTIQLIGWMESSHILRQPGPWSVTADWGERAKYAVETF